MTSKTGRLHFIGVLTGLILCMLLLAGRLLYQILADANYFPINTVRVSANYEHITRKQLEVVLTTYLKDSFFSLSTRGLIRDLQALTWCQSADVEREWPDIVKIKVVEKKPIAVWNGVLMTAEGGLIRTNISQDVREVLPNLVGPPSQQQDVLQNYEKLSKLLLKYGLRADGLQLRDNQAWELLLRNGILIHLGKRDMELRLLRFCRAYPAVFAGKEEQLSSVDLRYARGMAVQWKQQMGK